MVHKTVRKLVTIECVCDGPQSFCLSSSMWPMWGHYYSDFLLKHWREASEVEHTGTTSTTTAAAASNTTA